MVGAVPVMPGPFCCWDRWLGVSRGATDAVGALVKISV